MSQWLEVICLVPVLLRCKGLVLVIFAPLGMAEPVMSVTSVHMLICVCILKLAWNGNCNSTFFPIVTPLPILSSCLVLYVSLKMHWFKKQSHPTDFRIINFVLFISYHSFVRIISNIQIVSEGVYEQPTRMCRTIRFPARCFAMPLLPEQAIQGWALT